MMMPPCQQELYLLSERFRTLKGYRNVCPDLPVALQWMANALGWQGQHQRMQHELICPTNRD